MNRIKKTIILAGISALLCTILSCISTENPYDDISKSGINLITIGKNDISEHDTLLIDGEGEGRDSIRLALELKEFISEFSVHIEDGSNWDDTTIIVAKMKRNPIAFNLAFDKTGKKSIIISTYFTDNKKTNDTITVNINSKTSTPSIVISSPKLDSTITKNNTITVKGTISKITNKSPVLFVYTFVNDSLILDVDTINSNNTDWNKKCVLKDGWNSVSIYLCTGTNPLATFIDRKTIYIKYTKNPPPFITLTNPQKDSVITENINYSIAGQINNVPNNSPALFVYTFVNDSLIMDIDTITDNSVNWNKKCVLDNSWNTISIHLCTGTDPKNTAIDTKTIYIKYTQSIPPSITITNPKKDSVITENNNYSITGLIDNFTNSSPAHFVYAFVNDSLITDIDTITQSNTNWEKTCFLKKNWNTVSIYLCTGSDIKTTVIDTEMIYIKYTYNVEKPKIISILSNGVPVVNTDIFNNDTLPLTITVKKGSNEIKNVKINSDIATSITDSVFTHTVILNHSTNGNILNITVEDLSGKTASQELTVYFNNPPIITKVPQPDTIYAGSSLQYTVKVSDANNDDLNYTAKVNINGINTTLSITNNGKLSWTPDKNDITDNAKITISVNDGFITVDTTITFSILKIPELPLYFLIDEKNIVDESDLGGNPVTVNLLTGGTSTEKRLFTVTNGADTLHGPDSQDSTFYWKPLKKDVGKNTLHFKVQAAGTAYIDTFSADVQVNPINVSITNPEGSISESNTLDYLSAKVKISNKVPLPDTCVVKFEIDTAKTTADLSDFIIEPSDMVVKFYDKWNLRYIHLKPVNDSDVEPDEIVVIRLKSLDPAIHIVSDSATTTFTITNDD